LTAERHGTILKSDPAHSLDLVPVLSGLGGLINRDRVTDSGSDQEKAHRISATVAAGLITSLVSDWAGGLRGVRLIPPFFIAGRGFWNRERVTWGKS